MNVCIVGGKQEYALETSYRRAFEQLGAKISVFDVDAHQKPYLRLGRFGQTFHRFVPIDAWQRKLNRDLALAITAQKPDLVLVFCNMPVLFSTLAFVKSLCNTRFVLVWPDPLTNMQPHVQQAACLYDGVATYCKASIPVFKQMGFQNVQWIPLAADAALHQIDTIPGYFLYDLVFLGAWRPEREKALAAITKHFPSLKIGIWGTQWNRNQTKVLRPYLQAKPIVGRGYATVMNQSRINLNVIDDTCLPAANMRFFEVPITHGLQLHSVCPEFQQEYIDKCHVLNYGTMEEMCSKIEWAMTHQADDIRQEGFRLTLQQHTYHRRAEQLQAFFLSSSVLMA